MKTFSLSLDKPKPRNPVALPASQRKAGAHRRSASALRQQAQRALKREVTESPPHWR
jgi:hypothetical protein